MTAQINFENIALHVPTILLPRSDIDLTKWAVVACDQYTSQPDYWERVRKFIADSPSSLHLILPEVYLESDNREQMIQKINDAMQEYLAQGILVEQKPGFMLIDRKDAHGMSRRGLIAALDLEHYEYTHGAQTLIRATEGTILDRLPPRIQVRKKACLETPHIMVLIDDPEKTVIEPLFKKNLKKTYDAPLMMNSGHITGYAVSDPAVIQETAHALSRLADPEAFCKKYAISGKNVLLYAMGDGNHSFATAKAIWENLKKSVPDKQQIINHPARYALVELVNIHDEGLVFEPIHRVLFNVSMQEMTKAMQDFYRRQGSGFSITPCATRETLQQAMADVHRDARHSIAFVAARECGMLTITNPRYNLEAETLQVFLDAFLSRNSAVKIDYIHGDAVVTELGSQPDNIGFYLPPIDKYNFFKTIVLDGALPRKTFSMGEADDKRFYLECRKILA